MKPNFKVFVKNPSLRKSRSFQERFFEKVGKTPNCWIWLGARNDVGYGQTFFNGKVIYAHRVSYELFNGSINKNLCVLHRCDNPPCVNPKHLFLGTKKENTKDMVFKGRDEFIGEKNGMAKLTWIKVRLMRSKFANEKHGIVAKIFGISRGCVSLILSGKRWNEEAING